jgi:hypothetical protein
MHRLKTILVLLVFVAGIWLPLQLWRHNELVHGADFLVYDREGTTCAVVIPNLSSALEREAAALLSETLADAAGVHAMRFPVVREHEWRPGQRGIFVGETEHAARLYRLAGESALERPVAWTVTPDGVVVRARWRDDVVAAAATFLEQTVGARWFIPGPLGREVEHSPELRLALADHVVRPAYFSRNLGALSRPEEQVWYRTNRLIALIEHGHTLDRIYGPELLGPRPELAPLINGVRYRLNGKQDGNWQPDFTQPAAVEVAVRAAKTAFQKQPGRLAFTVGQNDSFRFDQSPATLAAVGPERYFRGMPDYSDLFFGYLNKVATEVAREFPDRLITTYSYYWTENAPRLHVEPNIVPFLTADRSEWFDESFAEADRALIRRWHNAGPRMFGLYDYYYGAPFFVPRPTLYAVTQPIPYGYAMGARAFYAESYPNWGLDGPKLWLAAQLLWDPQQDPAALLDEYYRKFWREAAGPMREYFELCDRQWLGQPKPANWIKYYKDEHQALLFPPEVRVRLRGCLERARTSTFDATVRQRLRLFEAGFALMDVFCRHAEMRDEIERLTLAPKSDTTTLVRAWNHYSQLRDSLRRQAEETRRAAPLAVSAELLGEYLRHDPRRRGVWELAQRGFNLDLLNEAALRSLFSGRRTTADELLPQGTELVRDPDFSTLRRREARPSILIDWSEPGSPWLGRSEPSEARTITLRSAAAGGQAVRFSGEMQESLFQWNVAQPGALHLATVRVRARVSPNNSTFLIVSFLDAAGRHIGQGYIDRLPVGEWGEGTELKVLVRAPRSAVHIGVGVRVLRQVDADYAEFEHLSLKRLE